VPRHTEEEQADFARALQLVADEGALPTPELDSLSMLEGADLDRFFDAWSTLSAPARARLIRALHGAALERLRLDYSALNRLALDDPDPAVRLAGVQSIIEDNSPALMERLLEMLRADSSGDVRSAAAEDLARYTLLAELEDIDAQRAASLRDGLRRTVRQTDEEPRVRTSALAALGYFSDEEVAEDPVLRLGAVRGMGRTADPRWTDRLMPVLGSDDPSLRLEAARALGEIEAERAVGPLVEIIDDPDEPVRLAVIEALGHIGGEEAREALLYVAEDAADRVREAAERALAEIEEAEDDPLDV
jgi:HEAT repeat protein